ncbi:hypothetical protein, partial [Paraburkholderia fungorum]|uniref:hypothetical protein n=2 Tax=Paraburkholderia fungorum TaxID=134537 RepID=UPI00159230BF
MKEGFFACPAGGAFAALFFVGLALWAFLDLLVVWSGVGLLAFPCFVIGLLALPLCGAACGGQVILDTFSAFHFFCMVTSYSAGGMLPA